ncbi:hypothetical protein MRX96_041280 [Rhipicephalus microplus]
MGQAVFRILDGGNSGKQSDVTQGQADEERQVVLWTRDVRRRCCGRLHPRDRRSRHGCALDAPLLFGGSAYLPCLSQTCRQVTFGSGPCQDAWQE